LTPAEAPPVAPSLPAPIRLLRAAAVAVASRPDAMERM